MAARQVHRPGDEHQARSERDEDARRRVGQDVADAVGGDEVSVVDRDADDEQHQHDEDRVGRDPIPSRHGWGGSGASRGAIGVEGRVRRGHRQPPRRRRPRPSSRTSVARRMMVASSRRRGPRAGEPAAAHDEDPIGLPDELGQLRRDHDDALPLCGELVDDRGSNLAPTSMLRVGSSRIEDLGLRTAAIGRTAPSAGCRPRGS